MRIERTILRNLIYNEEYARKVLPFIDNKYFHDTPERILFERITEHIHKYNGLPTKETLEISLNSLDDIADSTFTDLTNMVSELESEKEMASDSDWLLEETEKFCQGKAVYNAIMKSIHIIDDKQSTTGQGEIPKILSDALSVSFDPNIGHDYFEDLNERYEFYHSEEEKIPFDISLLNSITKGGLSKKSLNIVMAGTGVGKSLFMCHCAGANLSDGKNVLYITLEMAEERIAERIDANLLNMNIADLVSLSQDRYIEMVENVKSKTIGRLIVKEYPTAVASVTHFRHLLNELHLKKNFKPDIIYIDYLNICASSRIKTGSNANSYTLVKSIAEELRGLAVEYDVPMVSATQTTRTGFASSDLELTDTSESFGLPATADFMIGIITSEELEEQDLVIVKQLKNRYNDLTKNKRFTVGIDRDKMRLFDSEDQEFMHQVDDDDEDDLQMSQPFGRKKQMDFSQMV
ncbi:DNA primase [archaeon]|nr:DNA primase [archaeon]|tara:strand:- start:3935 stop:5323 length:1389 start_codon:yes stop_codon:yes gene_type:complete